MELFVGLVMLAVAKHLYRNHLVEALVVGGIGAWLVFYTLPDIARQAAANSLGAPLMQMLLNAALTIAVPVIGLMVMFGWRPKRRAR